MQRLHLFNILKSLLCQAVTELKKNGPFLWKTYGYGQRHKYIKR